MRSVGFTTLVEGTAERWQASLPDPDARASIEALAAQAAAGIIAELERGTALNDPAHSDDVYQLVQIAGVLGIGKSTADAGVREFLAVAVERAGATLSADDGRAWAVVTQALRQRRSLVGDEVRALVAAVDASQG